MGKIIEFKSEHDLDIGTVLWAVGENDVRKYKPCPACENQRTIKVTDGKGNECDMPCPRCTGRRTKGGACGEFKHYKADVYMITRHSVKGSGVTDSENLTLNIWGRAVQFYISEQEAKAEAKRLNAEQAALIKEFLEGE